jgi:ABC-type glycerol-3-phosphate transport system permease component
MRKRKEAITFVQISSYILILLFAAFCLYPLLIAVAVSFSNENDVIKYGYLLIPRNITLGTYKFIFESIGHRILSGYKITLIVTVAGTICAMMVSASYAYAASVKSFKHRNLLNLLCYIPMVFNAGILPWYIIIASTYKLTNTIWSLILPALMNLWNVFLLRNFFNSIPIELSEAAKIDGAGQFRIFSQIVIPVSQVGLITVAMFYTLSFWNDWYLSLMFIRTQSLYPLQYILYNMLSNAQYLSSMSSLQISTEVRAPLETSKMAVTCITIGPIILLYPFVQKYFVKGIVVGAVKG